MKIDSNFNYIKYEYSLDYKKRESIFFECFPSVKNTILSTKEYYLWKFHSIKRSYEYAVYSKEHLIGYYACLATDYKCINKIYKAGMVCDVMTSPDYRRKKLFTSLGDYSLEKFKSEGLNFTIGNPTKRFITKAHLKSGWDNIFTIPLYFRPVKSKLILRHFKLGIFFRIINFALLIFNKLINSMFYLKKHEVIEYEIDNFINSDLYENFFNRFNKNNKISLIRSKNFMKWRLSRPGKDYKIFSIIKNDELLAYAIVCKSTMSFVPVLAVIDIINITNDKSFINALFKKIYFFAYSKDLEAIVLMLNKTIAKKYKIIYSGFINSLYTYDMIINSFNNKSLKKDLLNESDWHLSWIDFDDH